MAKFVKHKVTVKGPAAENYDFYFLAPQGSYTGLLAETGVDELSPTSDEQRFPTCKVEELVGSGSCTRKMVRVNGLNGRDRYYKLLVSDLKVATFDAAIIGKSVQGRVVQGVVTRQRASFS